MQEKEFKKYQLKVVYSLEDKYFMVMGCDEPYEIYVQIVDDKDRFLKQKNYYEKFLQENSEDISFCYEIICQILEKDLGYHFPRVEIPNHAKDALLADPLSILTHAIDAL